MVPTVYPRPLAFCPVTVVEPARRAHRVIGPNLFGAGAHQPKLLGRGRQAPLEGVAAAYREISATPAPARVRIIDGNHQARNYAASLSQLWITQHGDEENNHHEYEDQV